jgi:threonine/homoserine/homoserine lactone efflux protein
MDLTLLALGIAIGVAVAAPIGPINLIVMRTALERGFVPGLAAGAGAVAGDMAFATIAAFGIRSVETFISAYAEILSMIGGAMLVAVGIHLARTHVDVETVRRAMLPVSKRTIAKTFALTITNPASLFGMLALFSGLGPALALADSSYRPHLAVFAVGLGSLTWWIIVSGTVRLVSRKLSDKWIDRINRWTGVLIAAFGFLLIFEALSS